MADATTQSHGSATQEAYNTAAGLTEGKPGASPGNLGWGT